MMIAIKVGGSVLCPGEVPDAGFVSRMAATLKRLSARHRLIVVVGGGRLARNMIEDARKAGATKDEELHKLGIEASRKNAQALIDALGELAHAGIPESEQEVRKASKSGKIVVLGGFRPGQTTDAVAAQSADAAGADLVIIGTDVKGVYSEDPKKNPKALFISEISPEELLDMVETGTVKPGAKTVVDPVAAKVIMRSGIRAVVLDIRDMGNLESAIEGREFTGTVIG